MVHFFGARSSCLAPWILGALSALCPPGASDSTAAQCVDWSQCPRIVARAEVDQDFGAIIAVGSYVYAAADSGILIYDASPSLHLVRTVNVGARTHGIAVDAQRAFVTTDSELVALTLQDPADPVFRGRLALPRYAAGSVVVRGSTAYVATGGEGVRIVDVTDVDALVDIGTIRTTGWIGRLAIQGDLLLVPDTVDGLVLFQVSNPRQPEIAGVLAVDGAHASAVAAREQMACLAVSRGYGEIGALWLVDLTVPRSPRVVSAADTWGPSNTDVAWTGDTVGVLTGYCVDQCGFFSLEYFDVANATEPAHVADVRLTGIAAGLCFGPDATFVAASKCNPNRGGCDDPGGIISINLPARARSVSGAQVEIPQGGFRGAVRGDRAIVATARGVTTLDLADPTSPRVAGWAPTPIFLPDLGAAAVDGDLACVPADGNGLLVVAIPSLDHPRVAALNYTPGRAKAVALRDHHALVADGTWGLLVIDLSNPAAPRHVGRVPTSGPAQDVAIDGHYAYVVDGNELLIVDVETFSDPRVAGRLPEPGAWQVEVQDGWAFVTTVQPSWTLDIVDARTPGSPRIAKSLAHPWSQPAIPQGSLLYLPDSFRQQISVLDIRDPENPTPIGTSDYGGYLHELHAGSDALYAVAVVNWSNVLQVLQPHCDFTTPTVDWALTAAATAGGVILHWRAPSADSWEFYVERAEHETGDWRRLTATAITGAGPHEFRDASAASSATYDYRVLVFQDHGTAVAAPWVTVHVGPSPMLSLIVTSPAREAVHLRIENSKPLPAVIEVCDVAGRLVRRLEIGPLPAGRHAIAWDGRDRAGRRAGAGVYLIRLRTPLQTRSARAVLLQ